MKYRRLFWMALVLALLLTGCTKAQDTLKFVNRNKGVSRENGASYELNLGKNVQNATITAEFWQNGECTLGDSLALNGETKQIDFRILVSSLSEEAKTLQVQFQGDSADVMTMDAFELPQTSIGYSFAAYELEKALCVAPGQEVILGALAVDVGAGVRTLDCESLINAPGKLEEYSCILVIRATFAAE